MIRDEVAEINADEGMNVRQILIRLYKDAYCVADTHPNLDINEDNGLSLRIDWCLSSIHKKLKEGLPKCLYTGLGSNENRYKMEGYCECLVAVREAIDKELKGKE